MGTTSDKLTYLNTTKTLLKNKINLTGANITNDTFRQYPTKLQNALLDVWNNEGEPIFTNWGNKVNGEGTNVKLDGTINARMKITPKGNTSQIQYSGKNLIGVPNTTITETDFNYNVSNGVITANKTDSSYHYVSKSDLFNITTADTYTFSITILGGTWTTGAIGVRFLNSNDGQIISYQGGSSAPRETKALTTDNINAISKVQVYFTAGVNCSNLQFKIQFEKGSTATPYEPYVGGTPSPNPNYPQNVNVVTGDNEIDIVGKNLFNNEKITRGSAYSYGTTGSVPTSSGSNARATISPTNSIKVLPSTTYTLSFPISGFRYALGQMDSGYISLGDSGWKTNTTYSFTTNTTTNYIGFNFSKTDNSAISDSEWGTLKNGTIQLEVGTATTYEPYTSQSYPLYLGVENLKDYTTTFTKQAGWSTEFAVSMGQIININIAQASSLVWGVLGYDTSAYNGKQMTLSFDIKTSGDNINVYFDTTSTFAYTTNNANSVPISSEYKRVSFTTNSANNCLYTMIKNTTTNTSATIQIKNVMLSLGGACSYTPYGTIPIELCKIGDYQDYIYKIDKWYLHKEVGKVVLNGTQGAWEKGGASGTTYSVFQANNWGVLLYVGSITSIYSDKLVGGDNFTTPLTGEFIQTGNNPNAPIRISILNSRLSEVNSNGLNTYLATNNITCYIPLKTPTETQITDDNLINQLESLKSAMSYEGQTNIDGGFMIVGASALGELE